MIYTLNPNRVIQGVSLLTFVLAVAVVAATSPHAARELWSLRTLVLAGPSVLIFALTLRPVFRWVFKVSFASRWLFPQLDGEWDGEIHSNWPRIKAMMAAASGDAPAFNVLADPVPEGAPAEPVKISAIIESGLFDCCITMRMSPTRQSRTLFVKPEWRRPYRPRLYYLYDQQEDGPIEVTDRGEHKGAAFLDYDAATGTLSGSYWTERQGELGLNTAGRIRLWRKT